MYIRKILVYNYSYAEYMVSDGKKELKCMCLSVPLPNGREPECGLEITKIFAFCVNDIVIKKVTDEKKQYDVISKTKKRFLDYKIRGRILDTYNSTIEVFNFIISLENDFPDGMGENYKKGDYIEFSVDRLDCVIEDLY